MLKLWPMKKRMYLSTLDVTNQDKKFQKWERKFLDRIKDSSLKQKV